VRIGLLLARNVEFSSFTEGGELPWKGGVSLRFVMLGAMVMRNEEEKLKFGSENNEWNYMSCIYN
jgi:hypothetical protein